MQKLIISSLFFVRIITPTNSFPTVLIGLSMVLLESLVWSVMNQWLYCRFMNQYIRRCVIICRTVVSKFYLVQVENCVVCCIGKIFPRIPFYPGAMLFINSVVVIVPLLMLV